VVRVPSVRVPTLFGVVLFALARIRNSALMESTNNLTKGGQLSIKSVMVELFTWVNVAIPLLLHGNSNFVCWTKAFVVQHDVLKASTQPCKV